MNLLLAKVSVLPSIFKINCTEMSTFIIYYDNLTDLMYVYILFEKNECYSVVYAISFWLKYINISVMQATSVELFLFIIKLMF
jgi:hypothetical protein